MKEKTIKTSDESGDPIDTLPFEQAMTELEDLIKVLELGNQTLEQSLANYERGQALARRCSYLLEQANLKVKLLSGEELDEFEREIE